MKATMAIALALCCGTVGGEVLRFEDLTSPQTARLERSRTVLVLPGGILEEHGPYLPNGADGIFNRRLADDLAAAIDRREGWTVVMLPFVPLGAGAANEIGGKYSFPGSLTIRPETLRAVSWISPISSAIRASAGSSWCMGMGTRLTTGCSTMRATTSATPTAAPW